MSEEDFFRLMLVNIANYQFGFSVGEKLFPPNVKFVFSKFFNRPKQILNASGETIATLDSSTVNAIGFYSLVNVQIAKRSFLAGRYDYSNRPNSAQFVQESL